MNTLIVIPARGGSKGIPRKNLRPVAGKPLIFYAISAALNLAVKSKVVVTTDDDEIALLAHRFGAIVMMRNPALADDKTTLDPVISDVLVNAEKKFKEYFDIVVTVQPTSPLITSDDIGGTLQKLYSDNYHTALTVVNDSHLCWKLDNGIPIPAYKERLNRQQLPLNYKETGAVIACTRAQIKTGSRIGKKVALYEIPRERSFDIDSISDLYLCESILNSKKIVFNVVGYAEVGLGHAYRAIMLANELVRFDIVFVCGYKSQMAAEYIRSHNYRVIISSNNENKLANTISELKPDLIINDVLDTSKKFMSILGGCGASIVNFEDIGDGAQQADMVINALYPHQIPQNNYLIGPDYFCLRDEFLYLGNKVKRNGINQVLLTFGGVDEGNITLKILRAITQISIEQELSIEVITGPGYSYSKELQRYIDANTKLSCSVVTKTSKISEHMLGADIAFTSGGRTVFELAALEVPTIVICQNDRETTHTFASEVNGVINLGHQKNVSENEVASTLAKLIADPKSIYSMKEKMRALDLKKGKTRVIQRIIKLIN